MRPCPPRSSPRCSSRSWRGPCARTRRSPGSGSPSTTARCSCRGSPSSASSTDTSTRRTSAVRARSCSACGTDSWSAAARRTSPRSPGRSASRASSLREVSADVLGQQAAGVTSDGRSLWLAPVKDSGDPPVQLTGSGEDLLRPAWDFSGRLWEVDRRSTGAVVYYLRKHRGGTSWCRSTCPASAVRTSSTSSSRRDGSRLIAVIRDSAEQDSIVVSRILTTGDGQVVQALAADNITDPAEPRGPDPRHRVELTHQPCRAAAGQPAAVPGGQRLGGRRQRFRPVPGAGRRQRGRPCRHPGAGREALSPSRQPTTGTPAALVDLAGPRSNSIEVDQRVTSLSYAG